MQIIDNEANSDIISWLPEGNGFVIYDKALFEKVILSKFMKKIRYSSFTRRMNRWNFVLYNFSSNSSRYFHPQFIRGDYASAMEMRPEAQKQWRRTKDGSYVQRSPIENQHISKTAMNAIIESNLANYRKINKLEPVVMRQVGGESEQEKLSSSNLSAPSARVHPVPSPPSLPVEMRQVGGESEQQTLSTSNLSAPSARVYPFPALSSLPSVGHNLGFEYFVLAPVPVLSSQLPSLRAPENYYQGLYDQMTPQDFIRPAAGFY
jgi:hypothetical protein